jgi:hypothetical protein
MPVYTGKGVPGKPGFEIKEFECFHVSPNGELWSSKPIDNNGDFIDGKLKGGGSKYHN